LTSPAVSLEADAKLAAEEERRIEAEKQQQRNAEGRKKRRMSKRTRFIASWIFASRFSLSLAQSGISSPRLLAPLIERELDLEASNRSMMRRVKFESHCFSDTSGIRSGVAAMQPPCARSSRRMRMFHAIPARDFQLSSARRAPSSIVITQVLKASTGEVRRCLVTTAGKRAISAAQYSTANMMVMTRSVTDGSVGSGE
jgi:hypothetical protein